MDKETLMKISGLTELYIIDRELDHMSTLALFWGIGGGFNVNDPSYKADVTPSSFALHLYARTQGYQGPPSKYFGLE